MFYTIFKVRGAGHFPVDMLRYDGCHPHHESDSHLVEDDTGGLRTVTLCKYHKLKRFPRITDRRWASFCWEVLGNTGNDLEIGTHKVNE